MPDIIPILTTDAILPKGYQCAATAAGIKVSNRLDMALFVSDAPASVAGTFTRNKLAAAPVRIGRERIPGTGLRGLVVNSGNANACTGPEGDRDARDMATAAAEALGVAPESMLMSSTGSIGKFLPMDRIKAGCQVMATELSTAHGHKVAQAMLTTDTRPKTHTVELSIAGTTCRLTGFAKGSGMIEPNMATMLAFLFTDAAIAPSVLQGALSRAVNASFNRISVDGDQSTNDTVYLFANGAAGTVELDPLHPDWPVFESALHTLCRELAFDIVRDGEGATRFITLRVNGASDDQQADRAARAIANSFLVKTGWAGVYPAWSRILDVLGYCDVDIDLTGISIDYNDVPIVRNTRPTDTPPEAVLAVSNLPEYTIHIDLGVARGEAVLYTCDCTEEYVRINLT